MDTQMTRQPTEPTGEPKEETTSKGYRTEFRYGRFLRRVPLPPGTSVDVVSASYRDGMLEVRMPAAPPQHSARRIAVDRG